MRSDLFLSTLDPEQIQEIKKLPGPILIVGAGGFLGAHFLFQMLQNRKDVYGLFRHKDLGWRFNTHPPGVELNQHILLGDICDTEGLRGLIQKIRPQVVMNLSAFGAYERQNDASRIHQVNYVGVLNLLTVLEEFGCYSFVQAGSSSEYGLACSGPTELTPLQPNSHYAVSKGAAALLIQYFGKIRNFPCANLRLYSIYGPWEDRNRLIPNIVRHGLRREFPQLAAKEISRDFVYADDCLMAFVRACETICRRMPGSSVNICTGKKTSLEHLAHLCQRIFDIPSSPQFGTMANRSWDLSNWFGDPTLAAEAMGWRTKTSLEDGLKAVASWENAFSKSSQSAPSLTYPKKISAVIACYKDHQAIPIMYNRLKAAISSAGYEYEIIFVNDSSPTSDLEEIRKICLSDFSVIGVSHSRNFGSQAAFTSGIEIATGDAVVLLDGDLQDPPELIPDFIKKWQDGYDVVYGERVQREAPLHMRFLYKAFYRVFSRMAEIKIPRDAGDFSLIDIKVARKIVAMPERDLFLRGLRAWVGFKQIGIPYVRPERMFGTTTNSFLKNIWWAKKAIFSFSSKPLDYLQALGLFVTSTAFVLGAFYFLMSFTEDGTRPRGFLTIVLLTLILGGLQIFAISIVGEYVKKITEEVKSRPKFIRTEILRGSKSYSEQDFLHADNQSRS